MFRRWHHKRRCRRLARKCHNGVLSSYIQSCASTGIDRLHDTPLIAVDLELTGLDVKKNRIIAIGWTLIDQGRIRFGSNRHVLINARQSVGNSATIHELTDSEIAAGVSLNKGLKMLFKAATGRAWVFHHAALDVAFLRRGCLSWAGVAPPFMIIDTMRMELATRKRRDIPILKGDLQLAQLRASYNLPRYTAHNALIDALATAELMLAQASRMDPSGSLGLKPYIRYR